MFYGLFLSTIFCSFRKLLQIVVSTTKIDYHALSKQVLNDSLNLKL